MVQQKFNENAKQGERRCQSSDQIKSKHAQKATLQPTAVAIAATSAAAALPAGACHSVDKWQAQRNSLQSAFDDDDGRGA